MKQLLQLPLNKQHVLIGCVHTLALPGSPKYDTQLGMHHLKLKALEDAQALADAGFDALLFCNESDMPYQFKMDPATIASMAEIISYVKARVALPHGVNMLLDPIASLALSHASSGEFIRGFITGSFVGDIGVFTPDGAALMRARSQLGANEITVIANITAGFSLGLDSRPVTQRATGAVFVGLADAVCVGGAAAGVQAQLSDLEQIAKSVPTVPVVVGTGVSEESIQEIAQVAHGSIVGTSIKFDRQTLNAVDPLRAKRFVKALRH